MTPFSKLVVGKLGISLSEANDIIWENKLNCLPIVDDEQRLHYLVFRKTMTTISRTLMNCLTATKDLESEQE